ncbi:MAG: hypothetical protein EP334_09945 [Gammaproteobacteria bacterium]|nr:MAG: hypothetical protein EP334_09945 [Gammaproteobacteria bacterium]
MSDRDYNRFDPIVPTSDDRIGLGEGRERKPEKGRQPQDKKPPKPASTGNGLGALWKFLVLVLLLGLGGLGYFFVEQTQRFEALQTRFNDLEAKIVSTDESLSQSGAALSVKLKEHQESLDKHWAEIKKLWGVSYDRNRKTIEEQGKSLASQDKVIKGLQASMTARKKEIATLTGQVDKAAKSAETSASSALAAKLEVNDMVGQVQDVADRLNRLEKSLKSSQQTMNSRISGNEEAIRAIDAYRLQINRDLQLMKQQLAAPGG